MSDGTHSDTSTRFNIERKDNLHSEIEITHPKMSEIRAKIIIHTRLLGPRKSHTDVICQLSHGGSLTQDEAQALLEVTGEALRLIEKYKNNVRRAILP